MSEPVKIAITVDRNGMFQEVISVGVPVEYVVIMVPETIGGIPLDHVEVTPARMARSEGGLIDKIAWAYRRT